MRWKPGDHVLTRFVRHGRIRWALPHVFVGSTSEYVLVYMKPNTPCIAPDPDLPSYLEQLLHGWTIGRHVWHTTSVLRVTPLRESHSVDLYWDAETGEFLCWYVNFQTRLRERPFGWDSFDQMLDIVVAPDGSWHLKDHEDFERAAERGVFGPGEADAVRAEATSLVRRIEAWEPPFCDGWERWLPDPSWATPDLPEVWRYP